jgi:hypothetical protein
MYVLSTKQCTLRAMLVSPFLYELFIFSISRGTSLWSRQIFQSRILSVHAFSRGEKSYCQKKQSGLRMFEALWHFGLAKWLCVQHKRVYNKLMYAHSLCLRHNLLIGVWRIDRHAHRILPQEPLIVLPRLAGCLIDGYFCPSVAGISAQSLCRVKNKAF